MAECNIIFVFTSVNTVGHKKWKNYVETIHGDFNIVPVAIDSCGLNHNGVLANLNCIRSYVWSKENKDLQAIVSLAHEIYRFGFVPICDDDPGKNSSIKIFLSHSKIGDTGRSHSESIKGFIDNTNMNRFFDATEIAPGFSFEEEIEKHIPESTLVAIESDTYSSRYWCQREVLSAKSHNCPIVVLNCLDEYEDRIFPASSNVPRVHVSSEVPLSDRDILRILSAAIIETIRHAHSTRCLEFYRSEGWVDADSALVGRPPEIRQVLALKKIGHKKICYPEPPIYSDEASWHQELEVDVFTPLWNPSDQNCLDKSRVGISISDIEEDGYSLNHTHADHLIRLAQDLARHLLARSATLLYGGDLRPDGFTEFVLDEAAILKDRMRATRPYIENHLAWPLYVSDQKIVEWRARYSQVMDTKEHDPPADLDLPAREVFLPPNTPQNSYVWSRCLTEMREKSICSSTSRICVGGKLSGYKGKMPGVLEEIMLALDADKPLYLLGAYGGVTAAVCKIIMDHEVPEHFTEDWQVAHNAGYSDLQKIASFHDYNCNYESVVEILKKITLKELSSRAGLDEIEYQRLMLSPFINECVHLIIKGLSKISK